MALQHDVSGAGVAGSRHECEEGCRGGEAGSAEGQPQAAGLHLAGPGAV